ncbi:hypothetical protein LJR225_002381 [Phenylobacterium sp. LjRoot225]|uniref:anti-sigma factor family protein n=1 Tax=Phenylobacterium sp. LjRoot225 TaxID=3342285 RepID=UPI003ED0B8B8
MRLTDDILSAYIDGELPVEAATRVALALTRDPDAVRRLDELRQGDAALWEAFECSRPGEADLTASVTAWMRRAETSRALAGRVALLAVAAALGFGVGVIATPRDIRLSPAHGLLADGGLERALDAQLSNAPGRVRIALTFRAADGRFCREFHAGLALEGLACRHGDSWRLAVLSSPSAGNGGDRARSGGVGPVVLDRRQEQALIRSKWTQVVAAP